MVPAELEAWWKYILTGLAAFAFVLRMEARISAAHTKIEAMLKQRDDDRRDAEKAREEFRATLAEMHSEIRAEMRDIKTDIKALLREQTK